MSELTLKDLMSEATEQSESAPAKRPVPCCYTCIFWKLDDRCLDGDNRDDGVNECVGICRRYPPVLVLTDSSVIAWNKALPWQGRAAFSSVYWTQPRVVEYEWCGEHHLKEL